MRRKPYPVLVYFGGRNCSGEKEASGNLGWDKWADEHGVFLVCPGFQDDEYWEPQKWSGLALLNALAEIRRAYNINDRRLCYYGYSAGSQAANLFAAWRPDLCAAWVSHACGVFHEPRANMRGVPGLVTCGDADSARYVISRRFVEKSRRLGIDVTWKAIQNHPHDVPPDSLALSRAFFAHHLGLDAGDSAVFVGDDQTNVYYPADSAEAAFIPALDRETLPGRELAEAWGSADNADTRVEVSDGERTESFAVDGVEFSVRAPRSYTGSSRIAVLFGGRGWAAERTLSEFGLSGLADRSDLFLLSPSFRDGEYWRPETGTGETLARAIAEVERRHRLVPSKVFLYGYSAGGQCAALFAAHMKGRVAAWGAHACGVFPGEIPENGAPALVTCGIDDSGRAGICRSFACRYRERGGELVFKLLPSGHELAPDALALADAWLESLLDGQAVRAHGEDDTRQLRPRDEIDVDLRNPLRSWRLAKLWRK